MKILFTCVPAYGHFNPLIPLATALEREGHTVAVATAAHFCPVVEAAGLTALPAGLDISLSEFQATMPPPKPGQHPFAVIFIDGLAGGMLPDLLALIPQWGADLIVHESHELGGPTAAEILGLPHVAVGINWIPFEPQRLEVLMGPENAALRAAHGLPADPGYEQYFRYLYLHTLPPSMSAVPESVAHVTRLLRPDLPEPPAGFSIAGLPLSPDRKTVYVTLGTVFHQERGQPHPLFATIIAALQDEPITLILTTGGDLDPALTGPARAKIAIERYIPLAAVLPHCDLVVSHGGFGTALGALLYGLPQLNLPLGADQGWNAEHLSGLGAGLMLNPSEAGVEEVRAAVRDLLGSPGFRERAQALQNDLAAMPPPEDVAQIIARLAG